MRIVGDIQHPTLKITVFKNDNRFSVKFEDGHVEQTYKFDDGQGVESLPDVKRQIDAALLQKVEKGIEEMKIARLMTLKRNSLETESDEFEEII